METLYRVQTMVDSHDETSIKEMLRHLSRELQEERGEMRARLDAIANVATCNREDLIRLKERDKINTAAHEVVFKKLDIQDKKWWWALTTAIVALVGTITKIVLGQLKL